MCVAGSKGLSGSTCGKKKNNHGLSGSTCGKKKNNCGDTAYALRPWILTPYLTPSNETERRYNNAHRRTRNIIERTFGLLKSRFRCLHRSGGVLQYNPVTAFKIVGAQHCHQTWATSHPRRPRFGG
ncbi:putative nuclease HARBI1 [Pleurodeles waltl]|uniref:putative nuclease HARBI1 n=1 Tax=Pleurodeles waltl TaxID=8319 RepID=UPI003709BF97